MKKQIILNNSLILKTLIQILMFSSCIVSAASASLTTTKVSSQTSSVDMPATEQIYPTTELPTETITHFIICSKLNCDNEVVPLLQDGSMAQSLNTSDWIRITMINNYSSEKILNATQEEGNPVIIAFGPYAPYVAEATHMLATKKNHKKIHSILLFNPIVTTGTLQTPINICYEAIHYRVYNFFAKTSEIYNYKIIPCQPDLPLYRYQGKLYIKGVNIRCYEIDQAGFAQNFPVLLPTGWIRQSLPQSFIEAWPNIVASIKEINNNFQINTNLSCILKSAYDGQSSASVPQKSLLPLVTIYRHIDMTNNHCLESIITEKGTTSTLIKTLSWGIFSSDIAALGFTTKPIQDQDRREILAQISDECFYNAKILSRVPYFQQFCLKGKSVPTTKSLNENQHICDIAKVRNEASLCHQEEDYVCRRKLFKVKPALERFLEETIPAARNDKIPTIAIVASGGGVRAMLTILGVLKGLEQLGLLNAVTYISALSGSTWAIGPWLSSGKDIDEICDHLTSKVPALTVPNMLATVAHCMTSDIPSSIRKCFSQTHTLVDYYGSTLLQGFLDFDPFNGNINPTYLSQQLDSHNVEADVPFPIYTTISFDTESNHTWYECTPFEFGQTFGNNVHYIPIWSLGRHFNGGYSQDFAPEISLGTLLGTFGSAFGISCKEYLQFQKYSTSAQMCPSFLKDVRFSYAQFFNPTRNMDKPLCNEAILNCTDAGIDCNLPYPPVSGLREARKADILIFVDASEELSAVEGPNGQAQFPMGETIQKVQKLFVGPYDGKIAFPYVPEEINCSHGDNNLCHTTIPIGNLPCTIFTDNTNNQAPTVVYMPLVKSTSHLTDSSLSGCLTRACNHNHGADPRTVNMNDFATLNLAPTTEQAQSLVALMEFNILAHKECFKRLLSEWIHNADKHTAMEPCKTASGIYTLSTPITERF